MRVEQILALLGNVRPSGKGWTTRCPAHEDGRASLSVGEGEDSRILLHCFAGCRPEGVVAALGLTMGDLMPQPEHRMRHYRPKEIAFYGYRDERDELLFQVVRYEPKDFRQRRPDENGGWISNLDGVRRVLYRLPELLAAEPALVVFLCEGEKDADRVAALGLVATTAPGGAGKWRTEFCEPLKGRRVVILADADEPGRKHAQDAARSLHGAVASVSVLELISLEPPAKDVSDWLDAGHTADELERLALGAPAWSLPQALNVGALLGALVTLIRQFVVMTQAQAVAWALWVVHTHALDAAEQTPYLSITSPEKRSGKTRVLEVSELVVARPWFTGRVSAAALVRKIDKERPSLLLDESDAAFAGDKDYAEALRGLLNTGHRANGKASLCVGQGAALDVRDFSTFCPKAIAGIGKHLPDTVADRAIPIRLQRKAGTERVEQFRERKVRKEVASLVASLEAWAAANIPTLRAAEPKLPEELTDRAKDGAEPLLAIADLAGGEWPERARRALIELHTGDSSENDSLGVRLLRDCRGVFEVRGVDRLASADLCAALVGLEESPWSELHRGKPLTVVGLARLLNPYSIVPGSKRLPGGTTLKGYYRDDFVDAWSRYCPRPPAPCPPVGFSNVTPSQGNDSAAVLSFAERHTSKPVTTEKRGNVNPGRPGDVVTGREPLTETENQCGQCEQWDLSFLTDLGRGQRIYLCGQCRQSPNG